MPAPVITTHQPSITEWFAAIGKTEDSTAFREEDNKKTDRLEILYQEIGLPYERPEPFPARALADQSAEFMKVLTEREGELCAIRLVPTRPDRPKLRQRGLTLRETYEGWFLKQEINPDDYTAFVCPHSDALLWSAIFMVSEEAIFGEIIRGLHSQLTHGDTKSTLLQFRFDFKAWQWSLKDEDARMQAERMVELLHVTDVGKQRRLHECLGAAFSHDYLMGYFEATVWPGNKVYFIDYNRMLPQFISAPPLTLAPLPRGEGTRDILRGASAYPGVVQGQVVIADATTLESVDFPAGSILACDNTDVRYLPLMRKAAAFVTNRGGILSHASIVAREMKKPCIVGTGRATEVLKTGDRVEVDATQGTIKRMHE